MEIRQKFIEATKDDKQIQLKYKNLYKYYGTNNKFIKFMDFQVEGYLRKSIDKVKIFQFEMHPKRYFIINFTDAVLYIYKNPPVKD